MKKDKQSVMTEKDKKVKSMLMQTYLTSLLCLVLCVTMFFGTSYAWFTSEISSTQNEIYIGILDVDMYKNSKTGRSSLAGNSNQLFDSNIRWEPGYTMLESISISNSGDLAFNYELHFTDGELEEDSELDVAKVAELFDVWVYKGTPKPGSYKDISTAKGWTHAGSLGELLEGKAVLKGTMKENEVRGETKTPNSGTTDGLETEQTYTIALHMKETATAEVGEYNVMGEKLTLNVKLIAYQLVSEADSMSQNYDGIMTVSTAEELKAALDHAKTQVNVTNILMMSDITLDGEEDFEIPEYVTLDGNGNTLTTEANLVLLGGTVSNMTVDAASVKIEELKSALVVANCNLPAVYVNNPGENVKFDDCYMDADLVLSNLGLSTVTLRHCQYRSQKDANAVFKMQGGKVACESEEFVVSDFGVVNSAK